MPEHDSEVYRYEEYEEYEAVKASCETPDLNSAADANHYSVFTGELRAMIPLPERSPFKI